MTLHDDEVDRTVRLGEEAARTLDERSVRPVTDTPTRKEFRRALWAVAATVFGAAVVVAVVLSLVSYSGVAKVAATQQVHADNAEIQRKANNRLAQDAYDQAVIANKALESRGQEPVNVPKPGSAAPANVIASAAVPIVLAELDDAGVSAAGIAARVAAYQRNNPVQVSTERLARLIANYLLENPPPAGPAGRRGEPGDTPVITQQDIVDAVNVVCASAPGGSCEGAQGDKGETGKDGEAGRGITGTDIRDLDPAPVQRQCVWVVEFTDGTRDEHPIDDTVCEDEVS